MNVSSFSELLLPIYQLGRKHYDQEETTARCMVLVNGLTPYILLTHTDQYSDYLFVVDGEKYVCLGKDKTSLPGEKERSYDQVVYSDFSPHDWGERGELKKLTEQHQMTKHIVRTNQGTSNTAALHSHVKNPLCREVEWREKRCSRPNNHLSMILNWKL